MATAWRLHGDCTSAWKVHGKCMESAWKVHGKCIETSQAVLLSLESRSPSRDCFCPSAPERAPLLFGKRSRARCLFVWQALSRPSCPLFLRSSRPSSCLCVSRRTLFRPSCLSLRGGRSPLKAPLCFDRRSPARAVRSPDRAPFFGGQALPRPSCHSVGSNVPFIASAAEGGTIRCDPDPSPSYWDTAAQ